MIKTEEKVIGSERLMCIHITIFSCYLCADFCYILNAAIWFSNETLDDQGHPANDQVYCRFKITNQFFLFTCQIADISMLILFIYLSV